MELKNDKTNKPKIRSGLIRPILATLAKSKPGLPMEEAIRKSDIAQIATNRRLEHAIFGEHSWLPSDEWKGIRDAFPCWTGTMIGYVKPGRTFSEETERISSLGNEHFIVHTSRTGIRYLFPVPEEHLDLNDCALTIQVACMDLITDGNDRIVRDHPINAGEGIRDSWIELVGNLPPFNGNFDSYYSQSGIPLGQTSHGGSGGWNRTKRFSRSEKHVGLISRGFGIDWELECNCAMPQDVSLGVAGEYFVETVPEHLQSKENE